MDGRPGTPSPAEPRMSEANGGARQGGERWRSQPQGHAADRPARQGDARLHDSLGIERIRGTKHGQRAWIGSLRCLTRSAAVGYILAPDGVRTRRDRGSRGEAVDHPPRSVAWPSSGGSPSMGDAARITACAVGMIANSDPWGADPFAGQTLPRRPSESPKRSRVRSPRRSAMLK
jgi:hypothetical protein